jgi:hypothetical protein
MESFRSQITIYERVEAFSERVAQQSMLHMLHKRNHVDPPTVLETTTRDLLMYVLHQRPVIALSSPILSAPSFGTFADCGVMRNHPAASLNWLHHRSVVSANITFNTSYPHKYLLI